MFRIESDRSRCMLIVTLSGFWTIDEAKAFAKEEQEAVDRLGCPRGTHIILADVTDFAVQTQDVSAIIRDLVLNAGSTSRKIALFGNMGLSALQSRRITHRDGARFFEDRASAVAWLAADDDPPVAET